MCGIFGAIHCGDPAHATQTVDILLALGACSQERGKDASGIAMLVAEDTPRAVTDPTPSDHSKGVCAIDQTYIVKNTAAFATLPWAAHREIMERATVFLGHTRWATQGASDDMVNASPLLAGALVGTHNGDIDPTSLPGHRTLTTHAVGATDTEILYLALNAARKDRRRMTGVLKAVRGRAALAFLDRSRPDRLYLARTALSPLCFTYDEHGTFYYASNPDWFRQIAAANPTVTFDDITLVPEGYLLTVNTLTGEVEDTRRFTPTCRESDARMMSLAAYRGFTDADKAADMTLHRHHVAQPSLGPWRSPSVIPAAIASGTPVTGSTAAYTQDALDAWRSTEPTPTFSPADRTPGTLDDRLAAEEPDTWETMDLDDAWTITDTVDGDDPTEAYSPGYDAIDDPAIDWDAVERWCWAHGDFDHHTYERLMDATGEREAHEILDGLRRRAGQPAPTAA